MKMITHIADYYVSPTRDAQPIGIEFLYCRSYMLGSSHTTASLISTFYRVYCTSIYFHLQIEGFTCFW
jgi:hypothetical protein